MTRHGTRVWYFREGHGSRIRIRGAFGSPEFNAALKAAKGYLSSPEPVKGVSHQDPRSLAWLSDRYLTWLAPQEGKGFSKATKKSHRTVLTSIIEKNGHLPFGLLDASNIIKLRNAKAETGAKAMANRYISVLDVMFAWAKSAEGGRLIERNPCDDVAKVSHTSQTRHKWSKLECRKFEAAYALGTRERLGYDLYCFTGQRTSDVIRMGWRHIDRDEGLMSIVQQKTGKTVVVPFLPELEQSIEAARAKGVLGEETFIASSHAHRRPMSADRFGDVMAEACDAIDIPECTAHGLRHEATMRCVENGADLGFLCKVFGYTPVVAQRYIDQFDGNVNVKRGAHFMQRKPALRVVKAA